MMNGTTLCPHCATRFKIAAMQLTAHHGMARCGHCLQAFDARQNFVADHVLIPELCSPQTDSPLQDEAAGHVEEDAVAEPAEPGMVEFRGVEVADVAEHEDYAAERAVVAEQIVSMPGIVEFHGFEMPAEVAPEAALDPVQDAALTGGENAPETVVAEQHNNDLPFAAGRPLFQPGVDDSLDFSPAPTEHFVDEHAGLAGLIHAGETALKEPMLRPMLMAEHVPQDEAENFPVSVRRRTWTWAIGVFILAVLLLAQSVYFFRVSLAAHLPALKPALVRYCQLLNCSVPLPQKSEWVSIESSGLTAEPTHENQITLNALLRNRAGYSIAFPVLALTLNDSQDLPLARRLFLPASYLPADESEQMGLLANHEVSIKLRLNTTDLKPAGYRLELFYSQ